MVCTDVLVEELETWIADHELYLCRDEDQENVPSILNRDAKLHCSRCRHERPISWFYKVPPPSRALEPRHSVNNRPNRPVKKLKLCRVCRRDSSTYQAQKKRQTVDIFKTDHQECRASSLKEAKEEVKEG